jgi:hypothetical protein
MKKVRLREDGRGQGALEYLMTYGWAILVILVVGVALWQMGVFSPPATQPGCSGFSQLMPLDSQFKGTELIVVLSNDAGTKLNIIDTNATIGSDSDTGFALDAGTLMRPGLSQKVTYTFGSAKTKGEYYRAAITLVYNNTMSNIIHRSSGYCWGTVE